MGHGADHSGSHGHGSHTHAGHAAGGHGVATAEPSAHGHAELPPAPAERSITPAPEDFRNLPGPGALLWPVLWVGLAALLIAFLLRGGWPAYHPEHAEGHGQGPAEGHAGGPVHEGSTPHEGQPASGVHGDR